MGIDRQSNELMHGFARRAVQRRPGSVQLPRCLHDRLEHRQRHFCSGLAAPKCEARAVAVVVADPDGDGDVICEADEPGIGPIISGAGLAADIGREMLHLACGSAREHALQH
jgi:hypothetical protein